MKAMHSKAELLSLTMGAGATLFAHELLEKVIITTIAMLVGTTISFFWKKYLDNKNNNK